VKSSWRWQTFRQRLQSFWNVHNNSYRFRYYSIVRHTTSGHKVNCNMLTGTETLQKAKNIGRKLSQPVCTVIFYNELLNIHLCLCSGTFFRRSAKRTYKVLGRAYFFFKMLTGSCARVVFLKNHLPSTTTWIQYYNKIYIFYCMFKNAHRFTSDMIFITRLNTSLQL